MSEHIVRSGETLYGIARNHHIQYWPNLYFAPENNAFRARHVDPNLIFPGDRIRIPPLPSIAPMERRPYLVHHDVPLFTQSADTCWRATGNMLYNRRNHTTGSTAYNQAIGAEFLNLEAGLRTERWNAFYVGRLGMTEARISSPGELHALIAQHGPVIVAIGDESAHSMVMAGYDLLQGRWFVLDPAAGESMTFEDDVVTVGAGASGGTEPSGPARLRSFSTAPATWENMGRWLWIFDTTVNQLVYYYR
jgi:hypothetical protein